MRKRKAEEAMQGEAAAQEAIRMEEIQRRRFEPPPRSQPAPAAPPPYEQVMVEPLRRQPESQLRREPIFVRSITLQEKV